MTRSIYIVLAVQSSNIYDLIWLLTCSLSSDWNMIFAVNLLHHFSELWTGTMLCLQNIYWRLFCIFTYSSLNIYIWKSIGMICVSTHTHLLLRLYFTYTDKLVHELTWRWKLVIPQSESFARYSTAAVSNTP